MSKEIEMIVPVGQPRLVMPLHCPFCGNDEAFCAHTKMEIKAGIKAHVTCGDPACRAFGPDGPSEESAIAKWNRRPAPKRQLLCGWRGMAGGKGCILPLGHEGGHGFSDGSGSGHNAESIHPETKP